MRSRDEVRQIAHKYADLVRQKYDPERIILFGSQVNGTPHEYSDIDIAIIFNGLKGNKHQVKEDLWHISSNLARGIEPHMFNAHFDPVGFLEHVMETGEIIYKKAGVECKQLERIHMNDIVDYWLKQCDDDLDSANLMLRGKKCTQVGFYIHLTLEKALKAVVSSQTNKLPPKTHLLIDLLGFAGLEQDLTDAEKKLLQRLNNMHIEATYPSYEETDAEPLTLDECNDLVQETTDFLNMIKQRLAVVSD